MCVGEGDKYFTATSVCEKQGGGGKFNRRFCKLIKVSHNMDLISLPEVPLLPALVSFTRQK